jgi:3'(2'),5'-bisphosphate nucleotidase
MTMTQNELDTLCQIAEAAGREIMAVYRDGGETWHKEDASPLTEADLRADRVIRAGLEQHFPGVFILSEESVSAEQHDTGRFFLVDPLDGTKEFLKRNGEFTVNISLIDAGEPVVGVVLAPALGECFYAARGLDAFKRDGNGARPVRTANTSSADTLRVMGSRSHGADKLSAWLAHLKNKHTFVAAGSSLKFCRIAEGQADIYPRFGPTSQWDTAAAQAVLEVAGGAVVDLQGTPLRYGLDRPVLNPDFFALGHQDLRVLLSN